MIGIPQARPPSLMEFYSTFSQTRTVGNNSNNANCVFVESCNFLHYLEIKMLVNVKLDVS